MDFRLEKVDFHCHLSFPEGTAPFHPERPVDQTICGMGRKDSPLVEAQFGEIPELLFYETSKAPGNGWLEDDPFPLKRPICRAMLVLGSVYRR